MLDRTTALSWCDRATKPLLHRSGGGVAAIVTPDDQVFASYGRISEAVAQAPGQQTLFEIGSITKVFTSILLAKFVLDGRIDLDMPIGEIRNEFAGAPKWITPRTLATHSSGMARIHVPVWRSFFINTENPYAKFSGDDLVNWMAQYRPTRMPKAGRVAYSNLGMGLLGYILGLVGGSDYATALQKNVLESLELHDTIIRLDDDQRQRFATPHYGGGKPTVPWDFDALAGAGALRSSAGDLAKFSREVMNATSGSGALHAELAMTLQVQLPGKKPHMPGQCLGWQKLLTKDGRYDIYAHDGGTRGSISLLAVAPDAGVAIIVLVNHGVNLFKMLRMLQTDPMGLLSEIAAARSLIHARSAAAA